MHLSHMFAHRNTYTHINSTAVGQSGCFWRAVPKACHCAKCTWNRVSTGGPGREDLSNFLLCLLNNFCFTSALSDMGRAVHACFQIPFSSFSWDCLLASFHVSLFMSLLVTCSMWLTKRWILVCLLFHLVSMRALLWELRHLTGWLLKDMC